MASIRLEAVSFHYETPFHSIFDGLSLSIDTGWRVGLVGRNGRGKTTLLGLIAGDLTPTRGQVAADPRMARFPHEPPDPSRPTRAVVKDSVAPFADWEAEMDRLLGAGDPESLKRYTEVQEQYELEGGYDIDARLERELASLGLDEDKAARGFDTLSAGEQGRALIAGLFLRRDAYPLIDEPTNHLDMEGRELLAEYLARKSGFLLVSHDRHFLDSCCDHILSIHKQEVRLNQGDFSTWLEQWEREQEHERQRQENLSREIKGLELAARKRRGWSGLKEKEKRGAYDKGRIGHLAARHMKRALTSERRRNEKLAEKQGLLKNAEKDRKVRLRGAERSPELVLSLEHAALGHGENVLFEDLSLRVERGDRIAIVGPNGCGKTTLLRAVAGEHPLHAGELYRPGFLDIARGHQIPPWSSGELREHLREAEIDETLFRATMGSLGVTGSIFERPLESFSMGELKKVDLCRSFLRPHHLLLWDEPMNYIDLASRAEIEDVILREEPTMLFVEHDRWFVERVATGVVEL